MRLIWRLGGALRWGANCNSSFRLVAVWALDAFFQLEFTLCLTWLGTVALCAGAAWGLDENPPENPLRAWTGRRSCARRSCVELPESWGVQSNLLSGL